MYTKAKKRLFLLNYDGTLAPYEKTPDTTGNSEWLTYVLERLVADTKNHVYVLSGRTRASLEARLGHLPRLGLWYVVLS